jgi:fructose-1,6-bisphosphatase/inositol monophosphatase family enzyme
MKINMTENLPDFHTIGLLAVDSAIDKIIEIRERFDFEYFFKSDGSPVTEADRQAEQKIIEIIKANYPSHRLHGEEFGLQNADSDSPYLWAFDPIDGTWAFLNHENTACTVLSLFKNNEPILGLVGNPFTHELFETVQGGIASLNGRQLPLTSWKQIEKGVLNYQLPKNFRTEIDKLLDIWCAEKIGKLVSVGGSIIYALANVAKGAYTSSVMAPSQRETLPWDLSAGILLVENAGGKVTDLQGSAVNPLKHHDYLVASANQSVHEEVLELLAQKNFGQG